MKWKHWLVWSLLAVWAVGLGACAAPEVVELRRENEALRRALVVAQDKHAALQREQDMLLARESRGDAGMIDVSPERLLVGVRVLTARWDVNATMIGFCLYVEGHKEVMWCGTATRRHRPPQ